MDGWMDVISCGYVLYVCVICAVCMYVWIRTDVYMSLHVCLCANEHMSMLDDKSKSRHMIQICMCSDTPSHAFIATPYTHICTCMH